MNLKLLLKSTLKVRLLLLILFPTCLCFQYEFQVSRFPTVDTSISRSSQSISNTTTTFNDLNYFQSVSPPSQIYFQPTVQTEINTIPFAENLIDQNNDGLEAIEQPPPYLELEFLKGDHEQQQQQADEMITEFEILEQKSKVQPLTIRRHRMMVSSLLKRSYLANSLEEIQEKERSELRIKRNEQGRTGGSSSSYSCLSIESWREFPADYFPKFIKTATCNSTVTSCYLFLSCVEKPYQIKLLKRLNGTEEQDDSVPLSLRSNWTTEIVTINRCCDCAARR